MSEIKAVVAIEIYMLYKVLILCFMSHI